MSWISVKEKMPPEKDFILIIDESKMWHIGWQFGGVFNSVSSFKGKITHWTSLPKPPEVIK